MPFYPNATFILPFTTIRRERQLPPYVTAPEVLVTQGQRIEADEVVLRGARSGTYRVVPMLAALGVKRAEDIDPEWLRVQVGNNVMMEQILAQRGTGTTRAGAGQWIGRAHRPGANHLASRS